MRIINVNSGRNCDFYSGTLLMTDAKVDIPLDAFTRDTSWPILLHADMNDDSRIDHCSNLQVLEVAKEVYVYAKQGKSCHVSLWNFSDLASSNGNLFELCPLRRTSVEKYVLPDDGVYGGLCNKLILIG